MRRPDRPITTTSSTSQSTVVDESTTSARGPTRQLGNLVNTIGVSGMSIPASFTCPFELTPIAKPLGGGGAGGPSPPRSLFVPTLVILPPPAGNPPPPPRPALGSPRNPRSEAPPPVATPVATSSPARPSTFTSR